MNQHRFDSVWMAEAPADRVWETLADYAAWPRWWRGVRSVEVIRRGDDDGVGTVLRQRWRSLLPFTLTFDIEMVRIEERRRLEGHASGDLAGSCVWLLDPVAGGTQVRFSADVGTTRWWMNLPVPFSGRVVRWNFEAIMRWGREGFGRTMGVSVTERAERITASAT